MTQLSNAGIPLRIIQELSGHRDLGELQKYLEVKPEQLRGAVAALSMLSHAGGEYVGKSNYPDLESNPHSTSFSPTEATELPDHPTQMIEC